MNKDWDIVNEQIDKNKSDRVPYNRIFGESLTKIIHRYRNQGLDSSETYSKILESKKFIQFLAGLKSTVRQKKVLENVRISVSSRYAENKSREDVEDE